MNTQPTNQSFDTLTRMNADLRKASADLSAHEARFLVDTYYRMQADRIRTNNQLRALGDESPHETLTWLSDQSTFLEKQIATSLDVYSANHPVGAWARTNKGVGPVIAAGLLAYIDIHKASTPGHIWSYAGLNPSVVWAPKTKRPWNAELKTLCWKLGESFIKVSGRDDALYGTLYRERKEAEIHKNIKGGFAQTATDILAGKKFNKATDAYAWYSGNWALIPKYGKQWFEWHEVLGFGRADLEVPEQPFPMLPPAHINARARRYAVKIFLAHLWEVWYEAEIGPKPPRPYAEAILGHAHIIEVPNKPEITSKPKPTK